MWEDAGDCLKEYRSICAALNLDKATADEAWKNYATVKKNLTLEGDQRPWLGCAIYLACRSARVNTVGRPSVTIEGNLVSLAGLLRHCDLSVLDFFKKCKRWLEWSDGSSKLRARLDHLERKFTVSMVVFLKYRPIFIDMFKEPSASSPQHKSKKSRAQVCSATKLFDFCWKLFLCLKSRVPIVAEDLVNSFHLLLATCDLVYANALVADRRDLLNPNFPGLPEAFYDDDYKIEDTPPCIVEVLCRRHGALSLEAAFAKTYCLRPQVAALLRSGVLQGVKQSPETLLLPQHFEANLRGLDKAYADYVVSVGDFDERVFLSEDANDDIGTKARGPGVKEENFKRDPSTHNVMRTPLSGRDLLKDKESPSKSQTPLATVTMSVRLFMNLISGRSVGKPSETLRQKFLDCSPLLEKEIADRVQVMGEKFMAASMVGQVPGHESQAFFQRRLGFASTLYYRVLESILAKEQTNDLMGLLQRDIIHQSIFACCLEIMMFSFNAHRPFPWVLEALDIEPYYFYRVIEVILRAEESFSRGVINYLNTIEERVLESFAWRSKSPLWEQIRCSDQPVPRCNEVSFSNQLLNEDEMRKDPQPAPARPQLSDRYASPVSRFVRPGQSLLNTSYKSPHPSPETQKDAQSGRPKKPARVGSLALFFRKFYFLANARMQDLCTRLDIVDISLKRKIWTCFEYSIVNNTELMQDRHLDQILMCAVYVMCRVLHTPEQPTSTQFTDILKVYRNQPQAESSVYRNVLLSKTSDPADGKEETESVKEERGNLIQFYNNVYMHKIQAHAREYVVETRGESLALPLSPLPRIRQPGASPSRKLAPRIFMNQMDMCPSAGSFDDIQTSAIFIHNSPAKDLDDINEKIVKKKLPVKRILEDSDESPAAKKSHTIFMKLSNVMKDRSKQ